MIAVAGLPKNKFLFWCQAPKKELIQYSDNSINNISMYKIWNFTKNKKELSYGL